jgi:hemerythrin-like domain-containing protein
MSPIETLMSEHRVIRQVLSCLEVIIANSEREERLDGKAGRDVTSFLQEFADRCHHSKEEEKLFPMLESRGMPAEGGPTSVMRMEHEQGRDLVKQMIASLEGAANGATPDLQAFGDAGRQFIVLLRSHTDKEDNVLFPMSQQILGPEGIEELSTQFREAEAQMDAGVHEKYLKVAQALADRYEVDSQATAQASHLGCGGGS